jgi:hypothetical protein
MYVRHEAMLSYPIARAQSSLGDVLQFEIDADGKRLPKDVEDVVNYVNAMNHGLERMAEFASYLVNPRTPAHIQHATKLRGLSKD